VKLFHVVSAFKKLIKRFDIRVLLNKKYRECLRQQNQKKYLCSYWNADVFVEYRKVIFTCLSIPNDFRKSPMCSTFAHIILFQHYLYNTRSVLRAETSQVGALLSPCFNPAPCLTVYVPRPPPKGVFINFTFTSSIYAQSLQVGSGDENDPETG